MAFNESAMAASSAKEILKGEQKRLAAMKSVLGKVKCDESTRDNVSIALQGLDLTIKELDWAITLMNRIK